MRNFYWRGLLKRLPIWDVASCLARLSRLARMYTLSTYMSWGIPLHRDFPPRRHEICNVYIRRNIREKKQKKLCKMFKMLMVIKCLLKSTCSHLSVDNFILKNALGIQFFNTFLSLFWPTSTIEFFCFFNIHLRIYYLNISWFTPY